MIALKFVTKNWSYLLLWVFVTACFVVMRYALVAEWLRPLVHEELEQYLGNGWPVLDIMVTLPVAALFVWAIKNFPYGDAHSWQKEFVGFLTMFSTLGGLVGGVLFGYSGAVGGALIMATFVVAVFVLFGIVFSLFVLGAWLVGTLKDHRTSRG